MVKIINSVELNKSIKFLSPDKSDYMYAKITGFNTGYTICKLLDNNLICYVDCYWEVNKIDRYLYF